MARKKMKTRPKLHIKKGDTVMAIAGADRGRMGKVLAVFPKEQRAIVQGLRTVKKHVRPNPQRGIQGGIMQMEAPIHVSNLMIVCPECNEPTRIKKTFLQDGQKVRMCKRCDGVIDRGWVK